MKVALYYPWVYLKSGCERTIVAVLRHSRHDWTIYTNHFDRDATFPELRSARVVELPRVSVRRSIVHVLRAGWQVGRQKLPFDDERALVVFCEGIGDFATFRAGRRPALCVCFTPLRAAFDRHYQENYLAMHGNGALRASMLAALRVVYRAVDRLAWRRYSHVLAISHEVKRRIADGGLRPGAGRVEVASPGIELCEAQPSWQYGSYFLLPGRIMWTKNIELAIAAYARLRANGTTHLRLVIAGFVDEKSRPYVERLRAAAAATPDVEFVPCPDEAALHTLYRDAYAVLYPPFNEDWGLVPLEAMAWGKPVIAVDRGGPRETVLDGQTGYLVPPDVDAFSQAMERLAASPGLTRDLGTRAAEHAAHFEMCRFVGVLDDRIDEVLRSTTPGAATAPATATAGVAVP